MSSNNDLKLRKKPQVKATKSLAVSTIFMIIGLILSKGSGFLREVLISRQFDKTYCDAITAGFQIPDFFFALLVGGSIQSAITPTLSRSIENHTSEKVWKGVNVFVTLMSLCLLVVIIAGELFSNVFYSFFNQGDDPEVIRLGANLARTLYLQIFFMMLAALCIGVLNAYKKFGSTAFGPTIYNVCVLLSIVVFGASNEKALYATGLGIMFSALIYFIFQLYMGRREIRHYRLSLNIKNPEFRKLFRIAVPVLISASIVQLNMVILKSFATRFEQGSLFALRNAETLWQLPYGIFAVGIGTVMLPTLSEHFAAKRFKEASSLLSTSIKNALFLTIPCTGIFIVLRLDVVKAAFKWSEAYSDERANLAAIFLIGYCSAIITQSVIFILNQAFYAIGQTRFPLFAGIISMIVNFTMCYFLVELGCGPISLTIAYSLSCLVRLILLALVYCRNKKLAPRRLRPFIVKSTICFLMMLGGLYLINLIPYSPSRKIFQLVWLMVRAIIGFGIYFAVAFGLKMEELKAVSDRYLSRFLKRKKSHS